MEARITNENINRRIHELMGRGCWHETADDPPLRADWRHECKHCGFLVDSPEDWADNCVWYTYDISAAFDLVEWMRKEKGAHFEISVDEMFWTALVIDGHNTKTFNHLAQVSDESLSMAISLACLKALGMQEGE